MSLVDDVERLGALVDGGYLGKAGAARRLQQASDGQLTPTDADHLIATWPTVRARYEAVYTTANQLLHNLTDQIDRTTGGGL